MNFLKHQRLKPLLAFIAIMATAIVINPISSLDIVLLGATLLVIGHIFLKEKLLLAFILIRPTLDWWRDYTLFQYHDITINLNATLAILLIAWSPYFLYKFRKQLTKVPLLLAMITLSILMLGSTMYSHSPITTLIESVKFIDILLLFVMAFIAIKEHVFTKKELLQVIIASAIIPIAVALVQLFSGGGIATFDIRGRIFGTLAHPNVFAFFILFLLFLHIQYSTILKTSYWRHHPHLKTITYVLLVGLLLMTYTRAAYVGLFIFIVVLGFLQYRKMLFWMISGILGFYLLFFPFNSFLEKNANVSLQDISIISRITSRNEDADSILWRQALIRETTPIIRRKPVLGYGYGTFPEVWEENRGERHIWDDSAEAHNDYLRLFLEIGAIGLGIYLLILGYITRYTLKAYSSSTHAKKQYAYMVAWIVVMLAVSLTDNMLHHTPVMWFMWVWFGAMLAEEYRHLHAPNFIKHT